MRNYKNILSLLSIVPFMMSCFDDSGLSQLITTETDGFVEIVEANGGISTTKNLLGVPDGENVESSITLSFGGAVSTEAVEITYEIDQVESTAISGVDYVLTSPTTVTIPAGEYTTAVNFEIVDDNLEAGKPVTIVFRLVSASVPILKEYSESTISIAVQCPTPESIYGTYSVTTTVDSPAGCTGVNNTVTIAMVDGEEAQLAFSDLTGGLYKTCYSDGEDNPGIITYNCGTLNMISQPDVVYGSDQFDGTGNYDAAAEKITITFSNGFGDSGTSVYTKQ